MTSARLILDFLLVRGRTHRYGPDRSQRADLHLPAGAGPHPVMVLIHGDSWQRGVGGGHAVARAGRPGRSAGGPGELSAV